MVALQRPFWIQAQMCTFSCPMTLVGRTNLTTYRGTKWFAILLIRSMSSKIYSSIQSRSHRISKRKWWARIRPTLILIITSIVALFVTVRYLRRQFLIKKARNKSEVASMIKAVQIKQMDPSSGHSVTLWPINWWMLPVQLMRKLCVLQYQTLKIRTIASTSICPPRLILRVEPLAWTFTAPLIKEQEPVKWLLVSHL